MTRFMILLLTAFLAVAVPSASMAQCDSTSGDGGCGGYTDDPPISSGGEFGQNYGSSDGDDLIPGGGTGLNGFDRSRITGFNRPEIIVTGPISEFPISRTTLEGLGAELLRYRDLPRLGLRVAIYDFRNSLSVPVAQSALNAVAPGTVVGRHHVYTLSQSAPRLYAPEMIGDAGAGVCSVPRRLAVGIIDGPVDPAHPALAGARVVTQSVLNADERAPGTDHGTAVAALVVGEAADSGLGGFARGAELYAVSAFTRQGSAPGADIERIAVAIDYLLGRNVRLINMSFAGPSNPALDIVLERAAARGAVMIAAAGNNGQELAAYPAAHPDVVAVTAVDAAFRRYRAANFGSHIEFAAPGVDLFVASDRGGSYASGTSYAAPIVTALAARLAAGGTLSVNGLRSQLRRNAVDLGADGFDAQFGWGLVRGGC